MSETRYQRIAREQRERQAAREAKRLAEEKAARKAKRAKRSAMNDRTANRIDGFDRDDIGPSRD